MVKRAGAARWVAVVGAALLIGCETPAEMQGPPLEPVERITRGDFYAEVSGAWADTIDGFAEFGRVTQILPGNVTRQMVQIVAVRRDTSRAARVVVENDDPNGFAPGALRVGAGLRAYVIRSGGSETLTAQSGTIMITESSADIVEGTFGFSLGSLNPPGDGYIEGRFRAERHLSGQ